MLLVALAGGCASVRDGSESTHTIVPSGDAAASKNPPIIPDRAPSDFSSAVAKATAAVVRVVAVRPPSQPITSSMDDEEARLQLYRQLNPHASTELPPTAARTDGSGFIVSSDGYVLTNAHLVSGASIVSVALATGREYRGKLIGVDLPTDVAVLKIEASDLTAVTLGDPHRLRPGQWVAAIGAPFGFEQSVVAGVVSAVERHLPEDESYLPFIQIELPLNPGNSGGPLLDHYGDVVGISAVVAVRDDGMSTGISFAIPIDVVQRIAAQLVRRGYIDRAELGIGFQDLNPQLAAAFGTAPAAGVLIHTVVSGGPADEAGLRVGDIIAGLNGKEVGSGRQYAVAVADLTAGATAVLKVWRSDHWSELAIRTAHSPVIPPPSPRLAASSSSASELINVHALSSEARRLLGTDGYLLVLAISERAAEAGLKVGDILLAVNEKPVRTSGELRLILSRSGTVALLVDRYGERMFIAVPTADPRGLHSASASAAKP
jgi:serine protease Do